MEAAQVEKKRKVGVFLGLFIFIFPFLFVWFLLRSGHSRLSRGIGFAWLVLFLIILSVPAPPDDPSNTAIQTSMVEKKATDQNEPESTDTTITIDLAGNAPTKVTQTKKNEPKRIKRSNWYEGGSLHQATAITWQKADYANKLATSADMIAVVWKDGHLKYNISEAIGSVDDLRPLAEEMVEFMDKATEKDPDPQTNRQLYANQKISELEAMGMIMMGWTK